MNILFVFQIIMTQSFHISLKVFSTGKQRFQIETKK